MSLRTHRALQALLLAALGMFLLQKVWSGTLFWYINQRFLFLSLFAALGFLALAQGALAQLRRRPAEASPEHEHEGASAWSLVIVALPLLLGLLIPARPLGSSAIANKGLNTTAPLTAVDASKPAQPSLASTDRTVLDWVRAFNYESNPAVLDGQPADVTGFVYHDSRLQPGQFLVGRFAVSCCVADAAAIAMIVAWPDAADLRDNVWVRVRGPVQAASLNGQPIPLISAEMIEQIAEPDQPYLYP
ncbi:MAG: TIGR03943 family putative permease subunit [Anaerolineales bacterium]